MLNVDEALNIVNFLIDDEGLGISHLQKWIKNGLEEIDKISKSKLGLMYAGMFQNVFNLEIKPSLCAESATEIVRYTKFLYPTKLKYDLLCALEKQIKIPPVLPHL